MLPSNRPGRSPEERSQHFTARAVTIRSWLLLDDRSVAFDELRTDINLAILAPGLRCRLVQALAEAIPSLHERDRLAAFSALRTDINLAKLGLDLRCRLVQALAVTIPFLPEDDRLVNFGNLRVAARFPGFSLENRNEILAKLATVISSLPDRNRREACDTLWKDIRAIPWRVAPVGDPPDGFT